MMIGDHTHCDGCTRLARALAQAERLLAVYQACLSSSSGCEAMSADPYRLVVINPPRTWASCRRCEWRYDDHPMRCEVNGEQKCSEINTNGECDRWTPRRSWWRRLLGLR